MGWGWAIAVPSIGNSTAWPDGTGVSAPTRPDTAKHGIPLAVFCQTVILQPSQSPRHRFRELSTASAPTDSTCIKIQCQIWCFDVSSGEACAYADPRVALTNTSQLRQGSEP